MVKTSPLVDILSNRLELKTNIPYYARNAYIHMVVVETEYNFNKIHQMLNAISRS